MYQQGLAVLAASDYSLRLNHWVLGDNQTRARLGQGVWAKSAHFQADKAGWRLKATVAQGDSGIDSMAYWENRPRTADTWHDIHQEVSGAMNSLSKLPSWQDAFAACQERAPHNQRPRAISAHHIKKATSHGSAPDRRLVPTTEAAAGLSPTLADWCP